MPENMQLAVSLSNYVFVYNITINPYFSFLSTINTLNNPLSIPILAYNFYDSFLGYFELVPIT